MIKISDKEYACAYKEVYVIINCLETDIRNKIPKEKIEFYKNHMDRDYEVKLDLEKELSEQNILYPTRCILSNLFKNYVATEEDRLKIMHEEQEELRVIEEEKRSKYNVNDIFNNKYNDIKEEIKLEKLQMKVDEINTDMIIQDKNISWFEIIKNKIKKIIYKRFQH